MYARWDKAIVSHDKRTLESMVVPTFVVKLRAGKTLTRKQFFAGVTGQWTKDGPREKAFTTKVNAVSVKDGLFIASIDESIVYLYKNKSTKKIAWKSLDTWKKFGKNWQIVATQSND